MKKIVFLLVTLSLFTFQNSVLASGLPEVPPEDLPPREGFRATVVKSLDGSVVHCERGIPYTGVPGQKFILIQKSHDGEDERNFFVGVGIHLVTCRNNTWMIDSDPYREEYETMDGDRVTVVYDDFQVFIKDSSGRVIYREKIRGVSRGYFHRLTMELRKTRARTADYEILVRAMKTVYANDRFLHKDYVPFGVFNLRLEH
ncbi:hypothetical protein [Bdellovibrio sp. HCB2-146]|uniref:hypothetical protein n=1 Tax=Bdellovibrio sp. HCB2-146 TaxID=3394362 RepID=UPI0039BC2F19